MKKNRIQFKQLYGNPRLLILLLAIIYIQGCKPETDKNHYPDSKLKEATEISSKGVEYDQGKTFYTNGNLESIQYYKEGKKEGVWLWYYNNDSNSLETKVSYQNDLLNGNYISYYIDGTISMYAIAKHDTTIYYEEYDKKGILINEYREVQLIPEKDTLILGERYRVNINISGRFADQKIRIQPAVIGIDLESKDYFDSNEIDFISDPSHMVGSFNFIVNVYVDTFLYFAIKEVVVIPNSKL